MSDDTKPKPPSPWTLQRKSRTDYAELWPEDPEDKDVRESGYPTHDQCVGYFERGGLYLYGARPGVGKTAMLLGLAAHASVHSRVYYLNMEMTHTQMWHRLFCFVTKGSDLRDVIQRKHHLRDQVIAALPILEMISPMWLEDTDFGTFARAVKDTVEPNSDSIIFIDYLGLFGMRGLGPGDNYALISEVARQLKKMAVALKIPVIAAAQLNRDVEKRKEGGLNLADLRGSGELENHADAVFGLTRENPERMDVTVLKNRNGPLTSYDLHFDAPRAAVEEWKDWEETR